MNQAPGQISHHIPTLRYLRMFEGISPHLNKHPHLRTFGGLTLMDHGHILICLSLPRPLTSSAPWTWRSFPQLSRGGFPFPGNPKTPTLAWWISGCSGFSDKIVPPIFFFEASKQEENHNKTYILGEWWSHFDTYFFLKMVVEITNYIGFFFFM